LTSRTYPTGDSFTFAYDLMGRLNTMSQNGTQQASASYGPAGELTSTTYFGYSETRTYNSLLQMTRQTVPGVFDTEYIFPTGANNGQISSSIDHISGQTVNYTYDSLKRLSAAATVGPQWGQAYAYDGFGNLTSMSVTQGSGVNWANASDPATNHLVGVSYDANGNRLPPANLYANRPYDVENRLVTEALDGAQPSWTYDPSGRRVGRLTVSPNSNYWTWTLYFYDIFGHQSATLSGDQDYPYSSVPQIATNVYFGNRLVQSNGVAVITDRLGSEWR